MVRGTSVLSAEEVAVRASRIRLLLTDCDGVLTDAGVYYGAEGEVLKRFSIRDGMGTELLRRAGIETGIVTGESSESVRQRARKLEIVHLHLGVRDKAALFESILADTGRKPMEIAYIGDDVNDEAIMKSIAPEGLLGAPADAVSVIRATAHYVCAAPGGHGAFREFADWILEHRA